MRLPRFIPKGVFQAIALILLLACFGLTIYWSTTDSGLFRALHRTLPWRQDLLTGSVAFLILFLIWLVVILPLRKLSWMPTLKEEVGQEVDSVASLVSGLARLYETQQSKNEVLYRARNWTPAMRRRARMLGAGYVVVGAGLAFAAALSFTLGPGSVYGIQILLLMVALALILVGIYQIITGKPAIRR